MTSTPVPSAPKPRRRWPWVILAFVVGFVLLGGLAFLLTNIMSRKAEAVEYPLKVVADRAERARSGRVGPELPARVRLLHEDGGSTTIQTPYGGSVPYDKLEKYPALKRIWAGYAFSVDYNEERGHYYALIDQKETKRQEVVKQPAACANCHAAEAPQLIEQMGWEKFNSTPYNEISGTLHTGTLVRRLPRPRHDGAADHPAGVQERDGSARRST